MPAATPAIAIREAHSADAVPIAALAAQLGYRASVEQMASRLQRLSSLPGQWVGVAQADSALLGWIHVARTLALEEGEAAEILGLVVGEAARRQGVGRLLVLAAEQWGRALGLHRIKVRSNVARVEAHAFYPALGFHHAKSQHVYAKPLASGPGA